MSAQPNGQNVVNLFVYGTLRPDDDSKAAWTHSFNNPDSYKALAEFGFIEGVKMYFSDYPVAVFTSDPNDRIYGYIISKLLIVADEIEEYPSMYDRTAVHAYPVCKETYDKKVMETNSDECVLIEKSSQNPITAYVYHRSLQHIAEVDKNLNPLAIPQNDWLRRNRQ
ncbi:predicted protein [Naegleria gruberi]|uniref:Predicted protein n=1 Tax=Naegleria gruberi TaxID=5762 RepID=D2VRP2_NAEGR|nr:uncharacterized protein NAEGRDRAFT_71655 [Naegleria gruberi]EFC40496.1 predicted protein [Naegleria gruberi]|eukprot:XP_002673240.1 predicted protein [Naegleria gruberi strain NEG-M]